MSFRARLTLALLAIATLPLLILGYGIRREMTAQLDADATRRVTAAGSALHERLTASLDAEQRRLESLAADLAADNRFRVALADSNSAEHRWLLDWAPATMRLTGYAVLQVQDSSGRILSSGQFRNDFDRPEPMIAREAVLDARTPTAPVRALVTTATFTVRGARYTVTGGVAFDSTRVAALSAEPAVAALLVTPDAPGPDGVTASATLPYVNEAASAGADSAFIVLLADNGPTRALKAGVTRWLIFTLGLTLLAAVSIAAILGRIISQPIVALSARTARLDLDRLDQQFASNRSDELGALERTLDALSNRLRTSVSKLREAERAAVTGDLARQVNHDIKNGLAPIRNVLRHLAQTAEQDPGSLSKVFAERAATLESSVEYLDALARNYARLSPTLGRGPTDPRPIVQEIARGVTAATVAVNMPDVVPLVRADSVVLHRILDNLVSNAVDSLEGKAGTVTIGVVPVTENAESRVRFTVTDTGRGMTREELKLAFDDFHTTKPTGTGLGLSVVRRLITDVAGSVKVDTAPGKGTTFTVEIPS
jgi:signal transduction histidine kinase